ncbi:MAG: LacI family DNA-binding transcriptional regulator [Hungatella sp.]
MQKEKATIKDIAKHANVSIATVSRYVNQSRQLNIETAQRVQTAIDYYNYIPNDNARALRSKNERIIGLVLPDISNSFFAKMFKYLEGILFENKIFVLLCSSDESEEKEREYLYRLLQKRVDAIVIAPTGMNDALIKNISQTSPVIIFDRKQEDIDTDQLYANDEYSAEILTNFLLDCGHQHIAYAMGVPHSSVSKKRYAGFVKAMTQRGLLPSDFFVIYHQDEMTCRKEFQRLLLQQEISAILITSPKKLNWFLIERNQLYLKGITPTLSFASYATQNEFGISEIPLTGMLQKEELYAKKLAKMIIDRLDKPNAKSKSVELKLIFKKGTSVIDCYQKSKSESDEISNVCRRAH